MEVAAFDGRGPADRLAELRRGWWSEVAEPGEAFGYVSLTSEYHAMIDAWFAELGTYLEVLGRPSGESAPVADPVRRLLAAQQLARLDDGAADLDLRTAPWRIAGAVELVTAPPPGDPAQLRRLAGVFGRVAVAGGVVAIRIDRRLGRMPRDAPDRRVVAATGDLVTAVLPAFRAVAVGISAHADAVAGLQARHEPLRRRLREIWQSVPQQRVLGFAVPVPGLRQLPRLAAEANAVLENCRQVYRESLDAAEELSRVLGTVTAQTCAQQAHRGGLSPATAVLLARTGILSMGQVRQATARRAALPPPDRDRLDALLDRARAAEQRAYLLEAFAAGHPIGEVAAFGARIRVLPPIRLHRAVNLVETLHPGPVRFGTVRVTQLDRTCAPTSMMVALAAADPVFALSVTAGLDPDRHGSPEAFLARLRQAEDEIDSAANGRDRPPDRAGTTPANQLRWMNEHAGVFGTRYAWRPIGAGETGPGSVRRVLRGVFRAAAHGYPVLLNVGDDHLVHTVLVLGHRGGDLVIYEPAGGTVTRASARDFLDGAMTDATSWQRVFGVILPIGG